MKKNYLFFLFLLGLITTARAQNWTEIIKKTASNAVNYDYFGASVSISGEYAIVGTRGANYGQGAAYIFRKDQDGIDTWGLVKKLTASDAASGDNFGVSVSVSGEYAIVGVTGKNSGLGAAYIFRKDQDGTDTWGQVKKLTASDATIGGSFGVSVSVSGEYAIVGASGKNAAYVYRKDQDGTDTWGQVKKLTASDAASGDGFGVSVSVSGEHAIVGAIGKDSYRGAAYFFKKDQDGTWGNQQKITASDAAIGNSFGYSVSISGEYAIVGAQYKDSGRGAAYTFRKDQNGTWGNEQKLTASDAANGDQFGASVSVSGEHAIVGAIGKDSGRGAAYTFRKDQNGTWGNQQKITASDAANYDAFGRSVSISDEYAIVGAPDKDSYRGAAYVFKAVSPCPAFTTTASNVKCNGGSDGSIDITVSGGTGPYQYSKDGGQTYISPAVARMDVTVPAPTFTGLTAGTYSIKVKDANGCEATAQSVTVTQPATAVSFTTSVTNVKCFGSSDGSITITASGGTGPYQYSKDGGQTYVSNQIARRAGVEPEPTTFSFMGMGAGGYVIKVKDANGCEAGIQELDIKQPETLSFTPTVTNVSCNGGSNGSIAITASGGTGPYTYAVSGPFIVNDTYSNLSAGTYSVNAKDANGCEATAQSVTIAQPDALTFTTETTDIKCKDGSDGSIDITVSGGTGPYQYSKDGGQTYISPAAARMDATVPAPTFTGLTAGTYSIKVKDANGCEATAQSVTVDQPATAVSFTTTATNVKCLGGSDGSIAITASGGTGPYQFSKDGGINYVSNQNARRAGVEPEPTGFTFTGLKAGTYSIKVKGANGCESQAQSVSVTQPATAVGFTATATNVKCNGGSDGGISIAASGGTGPYQYSINGGQSYGTSASFTELSTGSFAYSVKVRDANGCESQAKEVVLSQPSAPVYFNATATDVKCNAGKDGSITVTAGGGTSPYTYSRDGGANYGSSASFTGLAAGTYSIKVKDANGCEADAQPATVNQPTTAVGFTRTVSNVTCNGGSDGSIVFTASGGTGSYSYAVAGSYGPHTKYPNLSPGTYSVNVKDGNGCEAIAQSVTITQPDPVLLSVSGNTSVILGSGDGCTTLTANPTGTGPFTYVWMQGQTQIGTSASQKLCPNETTTYTVTATGNGGCTAQAEFTVTVQDIRCGNKNQNVTICYYGVTQCVSEKVAERYLKLGATLGACGSTKKARVGVEESSDTALQLSLKAYPNPVQDVVTLEVLAPAAGEGTFEVLDMTGRARQSHRETLVEGLNQLEFRLGALPTGLYLIRAVDALGRQGVVKVSKQ
ncbi:T9SS type A sorting domain-containing protein [Persicitalea jodogahamensis]|uniref:Uncharacterized protein n=1 Tax=Persicitalea jodogahamensis TaxID=402147 RepID=A0A8J3D6P8_9BACT|nr:T9SS type A sorting domain-containing protein [Persicitalea jodogahamensis]GHB58151.1 hypothetical protein GCM10007390_09530 [Persicitalea jodogahamensis]